MKLKERAQEEDRDQARNMSQVMLHRRKEEHGRKLREGDMGRQRTSLRLHHTLRRQP
jgi:hypothetical protein